MTCIIGVVDKIDDCVWIGGDSLGSNGYTKAIQELPKIFKNKIFTNVVMGSTSTFRHIDLLKYSSTLFEKADFYTNADINHEYMVTIFIPNIIKLFKEGLISYPEHKRGANFLVGAKNKLFEIQEDYSVLQPIKQFAAVGSGGLAAEASLFTTEGMALTTVQRIEYALKAAESCCCGVQRPFKMINTKNDEEVIIE